ncbi:GIY-YIG nuclease family protein [Clostridium beijerinckii]|uniref:Endonuclease n=1 Tax=Clostridium beijerinckii TaxID=1520 RepID=A0AAE5H037_CLOBE|nr:GIY-YIG nuclease family protein [Clostridium beijerinckii]NSB11751.1 putative endonuclease [Clostridium beijerinckii]NSB17554.1 putative endonuclease [Clostridium beijerinckii]OOM29822.1 GIY-YIG nuclease superfamily protein [Clostridium beijerinckii]
MNYVYIVECSDRTLYTGWTNNLRKRIQMHSDGCGAKYTRGRGPVKLVYHEVFENRKDAMKREYEIKKLTRKDKLILISTYEAENRYE